MDAGIRIKVVAFPETRDILRRLESSAACCRIETVTEHVPDSRKSTGQYARAACSVRLPVVQGQRTVRGSTRARPGSRALTAIAGPPAAPDGESRTGHEAGARPDRPDFPHPVSPSARLSPRMASCACGARAPAQPVVPGAVYGSTSEALTLAACSRAGTPRRKARIGVQHAMPAERAGSRVRAGASVPLVRRSTADGRRVDSDRGREVLNQGLRIVARAAVPGQLQG